MSFGTAITVILELMQMWDYMVTLELNLVFYTSGKWHTDDKSSAMISKRFRKFTNRTLYKKYKRGAAH